MTTLSPSLLNYDLNGLAKDLAVLMRIQDWDIFVFPANGKRMVEEGLRIGVCGECSRDFKYHVARILLNHEHDEMQAPLVNEEATIGWMPTLIHELYHIVITPLDTKNYLSLEFISDDKSRKIMDEEISLGVEQVVCHLVKIFFRMYSKEDLNALLEKHLLPEKIEKSFEEELLELKEKHNVKGGVIIETSKTA